MWWKGQYSTYTQFCYLVWKKQRAKGKTQNQSHSWHPELSRLHQMFTLLWKRQALFPLGTRRYKPGCSSLATESSKYYLEVAARFCYLYLLQKSLQNKMAIWHSAVPRCPFYFSLLSTGTMLQHILPPAYGSVCVTLSSTSASHPRNMPTP